ncbi:MAG: nucleotidyltransferase [Candidatus Aenigmatarchaeota archaeon]
MFDEDYKEALLRVNKMLKNYRWALSSSGALKFYGLERDINDIDLFVKKEDMKDFSRQSGLEVKKVDKGDFNPYQAELKKNGIEVEMGSEIERDSGLFRFDEEMAGRVRCFELDGEKIPILSFEDSLVLKAFLDREKDWKDLRNLPKRSLNLNYVKRRMEKTGCPEDNYRKIKRIFGDSE